MHTPNVVINVAYIKIPASMIITIIIILTRIGTIACARNTIIDNMSIRVTTAIIIAPITLRVTLPAPIGVSNWYYLTIYADSRLLLDKDES